MKLNFDSDIPIYMQIAQQLENAILSNAYVEESQVPSTTEISVNYRINPATALKGMSKLVDDSILYKKRGIGMFVAKGAKEKIRKKRKHAFVESYVLPLVREAKKLTVSKDEILKMVEKGFEQ